VKGREAATVELQRRRLREIETGKGRRRWGAAIFVGEEVRKLHGAGGE
jgi:hypothetical protein